MDINNQNRVDYAGVVGSHIFVLDSGSKGDGSCVQIKIQTIVGPLVITSLYALKNHYRSDHVNLWEWLHSFMTNDQIIICGDFNMTGLPKDSSGPSNFIHGSKACAWKGVVDQYNLVDLYLCATKRQGPIFTRQMALPSHIDQSRLDYFQENNSGSWFHHFSNIWHDDHQTLFDHTPVIIIIQLVQVRTEDSIKKGIYLKMDATFLEDAHFKNQIQEECVHPQLDQDPRIFWDLALKRVRKLMATKNNCRQQQTTPLEDLMIQLQTARQNTTISPSPDQTTLLSSLEQEVRRQEHQQVASWRTRSCICWLTQGEAPSRYFSAQIQAQQARDTFLDIQTLEGEHATSDIQKNRLFCNTILNSSHPIPKLNPTVSNILKSFVQYL